MIGHSEPVNFYNCFWFFVQNDGATVNLNDVNHGDHGGIRMVGPISIPA